MHKIFGEGEQWGGRGHKMKLLNFLCLPNDFHRKTNHPLLFREDLVYDNNQGYIQ